MSAISMACMAAPAHAAASSSAYRRPSAMKPSTTILKSPVGAATTPRRGAGRERQMMCVLLATV
jgi:hypothetical protein